MTDMFTPPVLSELGQQLADRAAHRPQPRADPSCPGCQQPHHHCRCSEQTEQPPEDQIHGSDRHGEAEQTNDEPDLLANLRNAEWLGQQQFPPLQYLVPGVIPEGSSMLVAPPKAGKSWMVLDIALAVASGGTALGHIDVGKPRPVLYLALEDGHRRLQHRCRKLHGDQPLPAKLDYLTETEPGQALATIAAWLTQHGHQQPQGHRQPLVILDTLGRVLPDARPGESPYARDYRIGTQLKRLTDAYPGTGLVTVHHDRKQAAEDFVASVSGTNGIGGAADTVLVLTRKRHETSGTLKVTGRDVAEGEYALRLDHGYAWTLDGNTLDEAAQAAQERDTTAALGDVSSDVLEIVQATPEGVSPAAVATKLDMTNGAAGTYLGRLLDAGHIRKLGRGRYAPHPTVESVESDESAGHASPANSTLSTLSTPTGGDACCHSGNLQLRCQFCQHSPTYWRNNEGNRT